MVPLAMVQFSETEFVFRIVREGGTAGAVILVTWLFIRALHQVVRTFGDQVERHQEQAGTLQKDTLGVLQALDTSVKASSAAMTNAMAVISSRLEENSKVMQSLKDDHGELLDGGGCKAGEALAHMLRHCPFAAECSTRKQDV